MRSLLTTVFAASLVVTPALAAECTRPAEHAALDVTALKTELMVMALTCQADDKYNSFVTKFRPDLLQTDKSLAAFFTRSYGRTAMKQRDDYVTNLANSQSRVGLKQGSLFCDHNIATFDEVMAVKNSTELTEFAAGKSYSAQPITVADCAAGAAPERPAPRTTTASRRR
jgi:hypothetical protein